MDVLRILCKFFYRAPAGCDSGKKAERQKAGRRKAEKEERGFVYTVILWPPPPTTSHLSSSWVWKLILDSDGDYFLFSPFFDRTPVSRHIDCCSLVKNQWILGRHRYFVAPKFVRFWAWRAGTISRYSMGEIPPIKARWLEATPHLTTACKESNTIRKT